MRYVQRLINLLGLKETELLQAIISQFTPLQPGALVGTWKNRKGYAPPESTKLVWDLFEQADFKCTTPGCGSHHRITLDHKNRNPLDSSRENLQVLCHACNRARVGKVITKHLSAVVIKAIFDLIDLNGEFPSNGAIANRIGIMQSQLSGTIYAIRILRKRYQEQSGKLHKLFDNHPR